MAKPRFDHDYAGVGQMLRGAGVAEEVRARAEAVASRARSTAPVTSGAYRDSIRVETDITDRVVAHVVADVPYALVVEFATGNLGHAVDAGGGR